MTTYKPPNTTTSGSVVTLMNHGDTVIVADDVTIRSTSGTPINNIGSINNLSAIIDGSATGQNAGLDIGSFGSTGHTVKIGVTGHLFGQIGFGAIVFGAGTLVENAGTLFGYSGGLQVGDSSGTITVKNDGFIDSIYRGIDHFDASTAEMVVLNTGTIKGGSMSFDGATNAVEKITNTGTMIGHIALGKGNDIYDGSQGKVIGDVFGGTGNDMLYGGAEANFLYGEEGNDWLDGGGGADFLHGSFGDDTYVVDNAGDIVDESGSSGQDTVLSYITLTIAYDGLGLANVKGVVENLTLLGSSAIDGTGNMFDNVLIGNVAANKLDGAGGTDTMIGGNGNDTYVVDSSGDVVDETGSTGKDTVQSFISYKLVESAKLIGAVENLKLLGTAAINGTGNGLANVITGNDGANKLSGGGGNDVLRGGKGKDTLTGGEGNDRFDFTTGPGGSHADTITDMNEKGNDTIRLDDAIFLGLKTGALAASAFQVVTSPYAGVEADDRVLYDQADGKLYFDRDGSGTEYKPVLFAIVDPGIALTAADFLVF